MEKEMESQKRFSDFCINNKLADFIRNKSNGDVVDGTVGKYRIQCKFVSFTPNDQLTYRIPSYCHANRESYKEECVDFFVAEVGGIRSGNETKYIGNFWIAPSKVLADRKIFETEEFDGQTFFSICPPDYTKEHWSKQYWNDISGFLKN